MALQEVLTKFGFQFDGAKIVAIETGVKRTERNLNRVAHHADAFQSRMNAGLGFVKGLLLAAGGGAVLRSLTSGYAQGADAIAKFATATGVSTETYQGLSHAVQIGGTTTDNLNKSLLQLGKRSYEAASGNKALAKIFKEDLKIDIKDTNGVLKTADQLFIEMGDGMKRLAGTQKETGVAMNILGRSGATLLPTFKEGSEGIRKLIAEAKKLGIVLTPKQLKAAENYNDAMLRFKSVIGGLKNQIGAALVPSITKAMDSMRKWWAEGNNAERVLQALKVAAIATGAALTYLGGAFAVEKLQQFVLWIGKGITALRTMGLTALKTYARLFFIVTAIAAVILAVEDLIGFMEGKDSITGRLIGEDTAAANKLRGFLIAVRDAVTEIWTVLKPIGIQLAATIVPLFKEIWIALKPLMPYIGGALVLALRAVGFLVIVILNGIQALIIVAGFLVEVFRVALGAALQAVIDAVKWIGRLFVNIWKVIKAIGGGIKTIWGGAIDGIKTAINGLIKAFKKVGSVIKSIWGGAIDGIKASFKWFIDKVKWLIKKNEELKEGASDAVSDFFSKNQGFAGGKNSAEEMIRRAAGNLPDGVQTRGPQALQLATAGGAGGPQVNTTVGAPNITVNVTTNDPEIVQEGMISGMRRILQDAINSAANDIKKPPRGQQ